MIHWLAHRDRNHVHTMACGVTGIPEFDRTPVDWAIRTIRVTCRACVNCMSFRDQREWWAYHIAEGIYNRRLR
jgi:hypothetical protein